MTSWRPSSLAQRPRTSSVPSVYPVESLPTLERWARARFLVVASMATDQCVDMAARDFSDRGYPVALPEDARAAGSWQHHEGALGAFGGYCLVSHTATMPNCPRDIA